MKPAVYVDTSAYLALLLKEPGWQKVKKVLKGVAYCASSVMFLEALRNLVRLSRDGVVLEADFMKLEERVFSDVELFAVKDLDLEICLNRRFPAVSLPKSLDLIHVRTALWFEENDHPVEFLTLDQSQKRSAEDVGLKTIDL